ncbi:mitochondrial carrier domain-containing protein [Chytriomyces sp. MP71]|nr:mitochondrial carrier domain-containing protein [Chytriomyces sp. MP71]
MVTKSEATNVDRFIAIPAGICSGATKLLVGHPFDTVKVRMQTEGGFGRFKGPLDCLMSTVRAEGLRALYRGATPPLIGWTLMDSTQLVTLTNLRILIQSTHPDTPLTTGDQALAGFGAGIVVSFVATPIELLKAKLQVQYNTKGMGPPEYSGPVELARKLVRNHGVTGLWQGLGPCLMFRSFFWALWGSYDIYSKFLTQRGYSESTTAFLAGGLAANTFWTISYPADVIKNRIMAQKDPGPRSKNWTYPSIQACAKHIFKTEGLKGFYRGFVPCFLRSFPTNGAAILVFETVSSTGKRLLN